MTSQIKSNRDLTARQKGQLGKKEVLYVVCVLCAHTTYNPFHPLKRLVSAAGQTHLD
jgi:hypothetical protein